MAAGVGVSAARGAAAFLLRITRTTGVVVALVAFAATCSVHGRDSDGAFVLTLPVQGLHQRFGCIFRDTEEAVLVHDVDLANGDVAATDAVDQADQPTGIQLIHMPEVDEKFGLA